MALLEDINDIIPKTYPFLILRIFGDATSDFVLDRFFKLNFSETTGHTNSKLGIIYPHTRVRIIRWFVLSL